MLQSQQKTMEMKTAGLLVRVIIMEILKMTKSTPKSVVWMQESTP